MFNSRHLVLAVAAALMVSCSHKEPGKDDASCADEMKEKELTLAQRDSVSDTIQTTTTPAMKAPEGYITVSAYENPKDEPAGGFGYDLMSDGKSMIHQPHIPAISGLKGFASKEDAEKAGNLMKMKIEKGIMPPTVSVEELDSMKIKH